MNRKQLIKHIRNICMACSFSGRFMLPNRIMRNLFIKEKGFIEIDDFDNEFSITLNLAEHMQARIFWMGFYSQSIIRFINSFLKPGMTVIDIGANIGEITLTAAKRVGPSGKVLAFEPVSAINKILNENIRNNRINWVKVEKIALSDKVGDAEIFTTSKNNIAELDHIGLGTLYPTGERTAAIERISLLSLDAYLSQNPTIKIDLIKIDIEGAEIPCLIGAMQTILRYKPFIIIELQNETYAAAGYDQRDVFDLLAPIGYTFKKIKDNGKLTMINADTLSGYQNIVAIPPV